MSRYRTIISAAQPNLNRRNRTTDTLVISQLLYHCAIDFDKVPTDEISSIHFHIKYSSGTHNYEDEITLKIDGNLGNLEAHKTSKKIPALGKFETNYKETLNEANLDQNTINTLYDLGADIKHLMDEVIDILDEE